MGQIKHKMGNVGGGVDISHKSKMSGKAKSLMSFPGGMPGPGNYGSSDNNVVGRGMGKYLAGESVGMRKYATPSPVEKNNKPLTPAQEPLDRNKDGMLSGVDFKMMGQPAKSGGPKKSKGPMAPGDPEEGELQRDGSGKVPTMDLDEVTVTGNGKKPKTKKGVDWSKAPKNNSQARRDWYTKNNLAQDSSTKLKSTAEKPKGGETIIKKKPKTEEAKKKLETVKAEAKEGQEGRQDTRKSKRISKRANRVQKREDIRAGRQAAKDSGLKGKAKRDAIKAAKAAAKKKQAEANKK